MLDPSANSYKPHLYFPSTSDEHQDSGVSSPPLWRTSPSTSPRHRNSYRSLSPASKAQAIARGQRELMEMVSKMPESCYELSLKDLVEVNANELEVRKVFDELPERTHKPNKVVKKMNSDKWAEKSRAGSMNNSGLLLKMVFPVNLGTKKKSKKKNKDDDSSVTSKGSRVSPRPSVSDGSTRAGDKDWWKKEFSESQGSESGISSINSGSTKSSGSSSSSSSNRSRSNSIRIRNAKGSSGCLSFLWNLHMRE